jgi:cysteine desulfurase
MLPYFADDYGNASSKTHAFGWRAEAAVDLAREQLANAIGANTNEIVFCSGATEANNLALRGVSRAYAKSGKHIVVSVTEHPSVLECAARLEREGWTLTRLPVNSDGLIEPETLRQSLRPETTVVSVMLVNHEIGVIQDIAALAGVVHKERADIVFHCDAAQALGKTPVNVSQLGVDLLTLSAHKAYGPKGVGALWRRRRPRLVIEPLYDGGGQEEGLSPGTLAVPLIVGFGAAANLVSEEQAEDCARIAKLRDTFFDMLRAEAAGISTNGSMRFRVAGNLNLHIEGVPADALVTRVRDVAFSTGSACASSTGKPSEVVRALAGKERARSSVRFGLGRFTSEEEIAQAVPLLAKAIAEIRAEGL